MTHPLPTSFPDLLYINSRQGRQILCLRGRLGRKLPQCHKLLQKLPHIAPHHM